MESPFDMPGNDPGSQSEPIAVTDRVTSSKTRRYLVAAALLSGGVTLGAVFSPVGLAGAQDSGSTSTPSTADGSSSATDPGSTADPADRDHDNAMDHDDNMDQAGDRHHRGGNKGARLDELAAIVGISADDLRTELRSGKTPAQVAEANGVSEDDLVSQSVAKLTERVNQAVTDGRLTRADADARLADAEQRIRDRVGQVPPADGGRGDDHGRRGGPGMGPMMGEVHALADSLGIDLDQLRQDVMGGDTAAEAAAAQGVTADQLKAAIVDTATSRIDQALADGTIDQAKADELESGLEARADQLLNGSLPAGSGGHRGHFGHERGLGGGPGGNGTGVDGTTPSNGSSSGTGETRQSNYTA